MDCRTGDAVKRRARQILDGSLVVDAHLDVGLLLAKAHARGERSVLTEKYYGPLRQGGVDVLFAACFVETKDLQPNGLRHLMDQISLIHQEADSSSGRFVVVRNTADIRKAKEIGAVSLLLAVEGAEPLDGDVLLLRSLYELGVRVISPCWSRDGWAAHGCRFAPFPDKEAGGLTEPGRRLIRDAEALGMLIDVSHCNRSSFWDVSEITKKPFMATHSNAYGVSPVARNLDDTQIRLMRDRNCVMGLNGVNFIVNFNRPEQAGMDDIARQFAYEKQVGSADILAMGFDQADALSDACQKVDGVEMRDVIHSHAQLPELVETLLRHGFSEAEIRGILGGNVMRLLEQTIG